MKLFLSSIFLLILGWIVYTVYQEGRLEKYCSAVIGTTVEDLGNSIADTGFNWTGDFVKDKKRERVWYTVVAQSQVAECIINHNGLVVIDSEMIWD